MKSPEEITKVLLQDASTSPSQISLDEITSIIEKSPSSFKDLAALVVTHPDFFELGKDPSRTWVDCLRDRVEELVESHDSIIEFQKLHRGSIIRYRRVSPGTEMKEAA